ncbi:1-deoxy-D-xylulose-5-phosphate reductoisomerase [Hwanghaeella grinnelliae]|uniref:1-deoxy-D-xylulose 5-phosphate reductoisomerase n=1 Tax=Hwanghaeella grinnelliae TaxID=2500179 RepID=A0A3S2ZCE1_9PROT|nr:1-deoxy-D-xylulose-5-phosphate reductoisomerase [Hwanghaeella grinnelliae]RVU39324.1 1-deoxy-D-xylulose-5-phosphate reductoisomerase [Hwanghaeella grinnelliae]
MTQQKSVSVLGSTGSVGGNTLDLVGRSPDKYRVAALTANRDVEGLAAQIAQFKPEFAVIADASLYAALKERVGGTGTQLAAGPDALIEAGQWASDWVMAAIVGAAGLAPTMAAVQRGAAVALANKECLVCAGDLMMQAARAAGARLLPADSEHNAIFQVLEERNRDGLEKIILTASGGPFRDWTTESMAAVTPKQALNHPNWDMGAKISIDSATMMNKGLEIIEAHHLFDMPEDRIDVVVHPQSIIHSMVQYADGSVLAQLGSPDMRVPIAHTLGWPDRIHAPANRLDFTVMGALTFEKPDESRFPALRLARQALTAGGNAPPVLNAANEIAVASFLEGQIGFLDIAALVEKVLTETVPAEIGSLEDAIAADAEGRARARECLDKMAPPLAAVAQTF